MLMSPDFSVIETCYAFSNSLQCLLMNTALESHWSVKLFLEQNNILILGLCVCDDLLFTEQLDHHQNLAGLVTWWNFQDLL